MDRQLIEVTRFEESFAARLPETLTIIKSAPLVVHPLVEQVTLHGSRGLAGNFRPDSDLDLSLLVSLSEPLAASAALGEQLREVIQVTLAHWKSPAPVDLAAIYPLHPCRLACFQGAVTDHSYCSGGVDCFGIYKIQKGFSGFVLNAGIQVERMYPLITVWKRASGQE
jgi:hypothetical protein